MSTRVTGLTGIVGSGVRTPDSADAHRVLVVEDDHGLRDGLARGLREEGLVVSTASNGAGAIRAATTGDVDAILLDIGLPDADGRDVCIALRCGGTEVRVSPIEFRLLARLLSEPGAVVRRRQLVAVAWPAGAIVAENTLDQYITTLRRKLSRAGSSHAIEVSRGVGFRVV